MAYTVGGEELDEIFKALSMGVQYVYQAAVHGNIAEFGTATGRTASLLGCALNFQQQRLGFADQWHGIAKRRLFLFDSFEGLPEADNTVDTESVHVSSGLWPKGGCKGLSRDELFQVVTAHLPAEDLSIYEGWFSESTRKVPAGETFALVHVDCDLYQSAMDVLDWLFGDNRLNDGSVLYFDDWNCNRASPDFGERRAWREICGKYSPTFSDCGDYAVAGHKFIIHKP